MTYFPQRAFSSHSNYLDIISQTGIVGSAFFVWLLLAVLVVGWKTRTQSRSGFTMGFATAMIAGSVGLMVAMTLGDWFIPFVYNQTIAGFRHTVHSWVLLGLLGG